MSNPPRGLYEQIVTDGLAERLAQLSTGASAKRVRLDAAEAADRLALHLGRLLRWVVESLPEGDRVKRGVELARQLVDVVSDAEPKLEALREAPALSTELLKAILGRLPDGSTEQMPEPLTPLLDTTLLTNAPGEPRVGSQITAEIPSADRIDLVMAFIRRTGLRPLLPALRAHCDAGRDLRVLTTVYTGSTEAEALEQLKQLGAEVRVSYDTTTTRLHAKAWLFHRDTGFSTAYVGSSNLTYSAQVDGLEWNVRVSGARNGDVVDKIGAVFDGYWNSGDFTRFEREQFLERTKRNVRSGPTILLSPVEIRPEPFQSRLLEQIEISRRQGHHRNLLAAATGTGKTVMAALDYARLRQRLPRARLLFIAHRRELLDQSMATFRHAMRDASFGELWVGGERPQRFEHVFASIQSLSRTALDALDPEHFDVVVVDEFHHAAAPTYDKILQHLRPRELLGLTATPERSDGLPLLQWFDGRIAAELRLWDAIDQHRLSPFLYFGVHDGTDLRDIEWHRGRGYDGDGLTRVLTADDAKARLVLKHLEDHAEDQSSMRVLGFCVSVEHARFMARVFSEAGVAARAVWGHNDQAQRQAALRDLNSGALRVLFTVDLFNEGVDVPTVDTLLLLRPTDSPVLFLQQLGRGLRKAEGKRACTVLDFVGHHRKEFRFDRRLRALLGGTRHGLVQQIESGFPRLPAGCHLELDPVSSKLVLENIKAAVPATWQQRVAELRETARHSGDGDTTLSTFLEESGLELDDVYSGTRSWSELREAAGLRVAEPGPHEAKLRRACGRLRHLDDVVRMQFARRVLAAPQPPSMESLSPQRQRLLRMLIASTTGLVLGRDASLADGCRVLWEHPQVQSELLQLIDVLESQIDHAQEPLADLPEVPLQIHARYTRREILAGFGVGEGAHVAAWQTGVRWAASERADLLAFTLDKSSGHFSPTTRYRDYAISRDLIHWESQSRTRAGSETGRRYQRHAARDSHVMLFARENVHTKAFWFLGPATYVSHRGERPMAVTWRLHHQLPGDLFAAFAAAVA